MFSENLELLSEYHLDKFISNHLIENVVKNIYDDFGNNVILNTENYSILSNENITSSIEQVSSIFIDDILKKKVSKQYWNIPFKKLIELNLGLYVRSNLKISDKNDKIFNLPCYFVISTKGDYSKNGELFSSASFSHINQVNSFDENSPVELYLNVNLDAKLSDIFSDIGIKEMNDILLHEMKHVFDYVNSVKYGKKDFIYNKYVGNGEYEAYTGSLLKEIENNFKKGLSFEDVLNSTNTWNFYNNENIFKSYPKVKKYMLNKAYQYWNDVLNK